MHGGSAGNYNAFSDLWIWDGATASWQAAPAPPAATARAWHGFGYESDRNRVVLSGGANISGHPQETCKLDPTAWIWADRTPAGAKPPAREVYGMTYDAGRKRVVLYGGVSSAEGEAVWEWNGEAGVWTQRLANTGNPMQPGAAPIVFDSGLQSTLLFGGLIVGKTTNALFGSVGLEVFLNGIR